jgi:TRAP transporter TAXI family solute receptor
MTFDDFKPEFVGAADSVELIRDGHLDAAPGFTNIPWSTMVELTNADKVSLIGIENDLIQKLTTGAEAEFYPLTIPAGTYKGQDKDVKTIGMGTILCIDSSISDEQVYALTKAIYDNAKDLSARHASIANIAPDQVSQIKGIPLHPGAEKYYKEVGALK